MTSRERWTVYPLILLALGVAVRDKFWPASMVRARSLVVESLQAKEVAIPGRLVCVEASAQKMTSAELKAQQVLADHMQAVGMTLAGPDGVVRACLLAELAHGGQLVLYNREGKPVLLLGVEPASGGGILEITSVEGNPLVQLRSVAGNGVVSAINREGTAACVLGSDGQTAGLFLELPKAQKVLPLRTAPTPPSPSGEKTKP